MSAQGGRHRVNHCAVVNLLRIVNLLLRSIFSAAGSFGNQRKGRNEKFINFAHFCVNSGVFFLRKTSTIHIEFCSGMPLRKVHEPTFLWCGLPGPLLILRRGKGLRSWPPSKEVPKPRPGKVPKKCLGKCRSETGCRENRVPSPIPPLHILGAGPGGLFSTLFSAPRFGPALSEALFRHFSWPGLRHFFRWRPGS